MTCIAALEVADSSPFGVLMGCDSCVRTGGTSLDLAVPKVFERGELLIGASGTLRHGELLHYALEVPPLPEKSGNGARAREELAALDAYMANTLSSAIHKLFKERGALSGGDQTHGDNFDGSALIAARGSIYMLMGNFSCSRVREFAAVGSGMDFALAAFHLTRSLSPRVRVLKALETAAHFAQGVGGALLIFPSESS